MNQVCIGLDRDAADLILFATMRYLSLLLAFLSLLPNGCSAMIAAAGTDLEALKTREQVRAKFGEPDRIGTSESEVFEEYHTRRKIRNTIRSTGFVMGFGMTLGLSEITAFPIELYYLSKTTLLGQELRFTYGAADEVTEAIVDGGQTSLDAASAGSRRAYDRMVAAFPLIEYRPQAPQFDLHEFRWNGSLTLPRESATVPGWSIGGFGSIPAVGH